MDPDAPDCQTAMYCNHYPSWEGKAYREGTLRRIAHTDFEILTLLFQRPGVLCRLHVPATLATTKTRHRRDRPGGLGMQRLHCSENHACGAVGAM